VIETLLLYGKLRGREIRNIIELNDDKAVMETIKLLFEKRFIVQVNDLDSKTISDHFIRLEDEEREKSGVPLTTAEDKKLKKRMNYEQTRALTQGTTSAGSKRKIEMTYEESEKKFKLEDPLVFFEVSQ
jgi:hypothetical protein